MVVRNMMLGFVGVAALGSFGLTARADSELLSLQGDSFVDITRDEATASLNIGDIAGVTGKRKCGFRLRSNQPYAFTHGLKDLAGLVVVTELFNNELTAVPSQSGLGLDYNYFSKSAYGTSATITTKSGAPLDQVIKDVFAGSPLQGDHAQVAVTLIPCTK